MWHSFDINFFHQQIETVKILNDDAIVYTQHMVHGYAARQNTRRKQKQFLKTKRLKIKNKNKTVTDCAFYRIHGGKEFCWEWLKPSHRTWNKSSQRRILKLFSSNIQAECPKIKSIWIPRWQTHSAIASPRAGFKRYASPYWISANKLFERDVVGRWIACVWWNKNA